MKKIYICGKCGAKIKFKMPVTIKGMPLCKICILHDGQDEIIPDCGL